MSVQAFCRRLPKAELHAHLHGSISTNTMQKLINDVSHTVDKSERDVWSTVINKEGKRTLHECFAVFKMIHELVTSKEALSMVTGDVIREFADDGVCYLELRTTPRPLKGISKRGYVDTVVAVIQEASNHLELPVKLLLSIDRRQSLEEALDTVEMTAEYQQKGDGVVVGIDLSGDPTKGDATTFLPALRKAREAGLKVTLHVAEVPNVAETLSLLEFGPDRVGHGTCLHPAQGGSDELVKCFESKKIPLEVCLTSNVKCRTVQSYDVHHFRDWYERGHPMALCTDDKGVFSTSLSEEYCVAHSKLNMSQVELWKLSLSTVDYTFVTDDLKRQLRHKWQDCKQNYFQQ
ncbi:adenosine deaminase-like protein [Corticium candelabrum]|uniref:adenosine deaminase-like protein n=1 Tax=Corticium candelabrum TaxID=121492 RepID=UPI002E273051|nr:adenosine deaminase-like protein [Corticium candelabrum]